MEALHLELPQGWRRPWCEQYGALDLIPSRHKLCETEPTELLGIEGYTKLNRSQFVRLSRELSDSSPALRGTNVQVLRDICLVANFSEEFFLRVSKDQWLRTAINCDEENTNALFSSDVTKIMDSITIHSKVVPYWPKLDRVLRVDSAGKRLLYFPTTFFDVAVSENKSLVEMSDKWAEDQWCNDRLDDDDEDEGDQPLKDGITPFWEVESGDVVEVKNDFGKGGQATVGTFLWRGGIFARKVFKFKKEFFAELEVVRRVSHPHIVYSFGLSICPNVKKQTRHLERWYTRPFVSRIKTERKELDEDVDHQHSLLMELLDGDLFMLIRDCVRCDEHRSKPPFSRRDSVHILLQVAQAMAYLHGLDEPVIHGDLKSHNILVSKTCGIFGDVSQYFVKVADFGSARILHSSSSPKFLPSTGTTKYAAGEILKARSDQNLVIDCPQKIDVYSFGIIAFEVLTGLEPYNRSLTVLVTKPGVTGLMPYEGVANRSEFTKGVIAGTLRPPLREACNRPGFWSDQPDLISLVESCWHHEPSDRPHFSEVAQTLQSIYSEVVNQEPMDGSNVSSAPPQAGPSQVFDHTQVCSLVSKAESNSSVPHLNRSSICTEYAIQEQPGTSLGAIRC